MITVLALGPKKEVADVGVRGWTQSRSFKWIDSIHPTAGDLSLISKRTGLTPAELRDAVDTGKRPHILPGDDHSLITLRAPFIKGNEVHMATVALFLFKNQLVVIRDHDVHGLAHLHVAPPHHLTAMFNRGGPFLVYRIIQAIVEDFYELMEDVSGDIDDLEDLVLNEPSKSVSESIFVQKRKLIYLHKALAANREVLAGLEKHYVKDFTGTNLRHLRSLYNDTTQLLDIISTERDVQASVLDMYVSSVSNNLNKVMKTLTLISAYVMLPTLIGSIYGMNFALMPELQWEHGYLFALGLMALSVLFVHIYFRRKGWVEWP